MPRIDRGYVSNSTQYPRLRVRGDYAFAERARGSFASVAVIPSRAARANSAQPKWISVLLHPVPRQTTQNSAPDQNPNFSRCPLPLHRGQRMEGCMTKMLPLRKVGRDSASGLARVGLSAGSGPLISFELSVSGYAVTRELGVSRPHLIFMSHLAVLIGYAPTNAKRDSFDKLMWPAMVVLIKTVLDGTLPGSPLSITDILSALTLTALRDRQPGCHRGGTTRSTPVRDTVPAKP
jgi:hypothetical protein